MNAISKVAPIERPSRPNLAEARRFIKHMVGRTDAPITLQTFDDAPAKRSLARVLHGTIDQHAAQLSSLQREGAGVFWMVNAGDFNGRSEDNVTAVRFLFADLDGARLEPIREALKPHAVIESSPGRWHVYYRVADCPKHRFKSLQSAIARRFGSDPSVCDLPRVMRVPGFSHMKGDPFMSRIVELNDMPAYLLGVIEFDLLEDDAPTDTAIPTSAALKDVADALAILHPQSLDDTPGNRARVSGALATLSADCSREAWRNIVFSTLSSGLPDAEELARTWSRTAPHRYDEGAFDLLVKSFKYERRHDGNLIGPGTLFHLAKAAGWSDPRKPERETFGDLSNGRRFAEKFRGKFLYVHASKKWLYWSGTHWVWCEGGEAIQAARTIVTQALDDALSTWQNDPTDYNRNNYNQAVSVHRNARRLDALLTVATTEPGMGIASPALLDANPLLLGVRNGVVNLRDGSLLVPDPAMHISRQAGAAFNREARCPKWLKFLHDVFKGDSELIAFIQRACGYSLTGLMDEEVLFFMWGHGANGKSVFANVLHAVFGDYAVTVRATMLARDAKGNSGEAEREKARLPGARLALINEVGSADVFDDQRVKELVSRERVSARALYAESFEFMPTHTIWIRGNNQPGAMDTSDGFWRRIHLIGFTRQFAEDERVPDLDRQIIDSERDGILAWMIEGCVHWQREKLHAPASVKAASAQWRGDTDLIGQWLEACCRLDAHAETPVSRLFESYCAFLRKGNIKEPTCLVFGRQLSQRGYGQRRTNAARLTQGIALIDLFEAERDDDI